MAVSGPSNSIAESPKGMSTAAGVVAGAAAAAATKTSISDKERRNPKAKEVVSEQKYMFVILISIFLPLIVGFLQVETDQSEQKAKNDSTLANVSIIFYYTREYARTSNFIRGLVLV
jgi:ABC-type nitrate/sulfonate/bicarbonate transport system ATPase subunit